MQKLFLNLTIVFSFIVSTSSVIAEDNQVPVGESRLFCEDSKLELNAELADEQLNITRKKGYAPIRFTVHEQLSKPYKIVSAYTYVINNFDRPKLQHCVLVEKL